MQRILVTGGAGFIGTNFVFEWLAAHPASEVTIIDKLTYAANPFATAELVRDARCRLVRGDVTDRALLESVFSTVRPQAVIHFAAESHVDRSIAGPDPFVQTNIVGTYELLEAARRYGAKAPFRFLHVSTDEVFGALGPTGMFDEASSYAPRSPYAASKAASDHLVLAYVHTYGLPAIITNCTNNYGPYQHPEKLIPRMIANALAGEVLPIYGRGDNVRDWIHVADHCGALRTVLAHGRIGERYVIGARCERSNLDLVHAICDLLDELVPRRDRYRALCTFVADRPGHDFRYAVEPAKIERLGWRASVPFADGLRRTVTWYLARAAREAA